MNTEKTIFQKIIDDEIPSTKICDNENFAAFLDAFPTSPGHTLVVTKEPYKDLLETPDEISGKLLTFVKKLSIKIKEATGADGIKLIMNNGSAAGQEVFHIHCHIIPRFKGDKWPAKYEYKEGEARSIAEKIIQEISE
jgi:histidine triad (HIT) family protein